MQDFRDFIARGNVVDLAVGVIIGGAFGKIVTGLVDQIVMPPIGLITGGIDISDLKILLKAADAATKKPEVVIAYGAFINTLIQFYIIAVVIFLIVKLVNNMRKPEAAPPVAPPAPTATEALLMEIRDTLQRGAQPAYTIAA